MPSKRPVNWELALLRQNPFPEIPPRAPADIVWAGMHNLKRQFELLFTEAQTTPDLQAVLNFGDWGSGKTHAAIYFGEKARLPKIEGGDQVSDVINVYVRTPKDAAQAEKLLYQDIIEALGFNRLRQVVRDVLAEYGLDEAFQRIREATESEALANAVLLLGQERRNVVSQLELFTDESKEDREWRRLLEAYFFAQQTKSDLRQLGLSRGIEGSRDRFRVLSGLIQCLVGFAASEELEAHYRVVLWIDEMEDLIYFPSRQYLPFTQSLRDLIDRLPNYFTLIVNFTLATPEAFEDVSVVLGKALMSRFSHQIFFKPPDEQEALTYVLDLLSHFRTEDPVRLKLPDTYPFSRTALQEIIATIPVRTPRAINKRCSDIIVHALMEGIISGPGQGIIEIDFVSRLDQERLEQEF